MTKSREGDIDGGYLPEVIITAKAIHHDNNNEGGYDADDWWCPNTDLTDWYPSGGDGNLYPIPGGGDSGIGNGNLTFYDSFFINAENICHEWIHLCQSCLFSPKEFTGDFKDYEGMCEFQLVVIQDMMQYVKEGVVTHSENEAEYPIHMSWLNSIDYTNNQQIKNLPYLYGIWIASMCLNRKLPEKVNLDTNYYRFCDYFFKYSRAYGNKGYKVSHYYGNKSLNTILKTVRDCLNNK